MATSSYRLQQSLSRLRAPPVMRLSRNAFHNRSAFNTSTWSESARLYATESGSSQLVEPPDYLSAGERKIFDMIKEGLEPTALEVQDVSGGCGSMYALDIVSAQFKGLPVIKQHRLVNKVLGEEIKKWHGVQMKTRAP